MEKTKNYITRDLTVIFYSYVSNLAWKLITSNRGSGVWNNNRNNNKQHYR